MAKEKTKDEEKPKEEGRKSAIDFKSRKVVLALTILLAIIISAGAYFLIVSPQLARVGAAREFDVSSSEASVTSKKAYLDQLKQMKSNYEQIDSADVEVLSAILPGNVWAPELLSQLEAIAKRSGVGLLGVNIAEVEETDVRTARQRLQAQAGQAAEAPKSKDIREVNLQLEISAFDYPSYKRFLEALQTHIRIMDVEQFSFNTENDTHSLRVKTYFVESK